MQFITLASAAMTAIVGLASAVPSTATSDGKPPCPTFQLQAQALPGQSKQFNGLFVEAYHTGAGENNLQLGNSFKETYYLNHSLIMSNLDPQDNQVYTWYNGIDNNYAAWDAVQLNIGYGGPTIDYGVFSFNSSGLQWSDSPSNPSENGFGGWLACQWFLGVPQLFYLIKGYNDAIPCSCAKVDLLPVCSK